MTRGKFTKGPAHVSGSDDGPGERHLHIGAAEEIQTLASMNPTHPCTPANAQLITAAINAATAAEKLGYDGQRAIEELPRLLEALEWYYRDDCRAVEGGILEDTTKRPANALLIACRVKEVSHD